MDQVGVPETSELQAFVAVVEGGSISAASRELGVPRATVSRRLALLEERLGVRLLHRTTRKMRLTDAGVEFYRHAREIVLAVDAARAAVRQGDGEPRGLLRVSVPPTDVRFREVLCAFAERYPEVEIELIASTRHEDLIARGIDVAWRAAADLDPGLIARGMRTLELIAVASPAYVEAHGCPRTVDELDGHACLLGFEGGERPETHWPLRDGGRVRVRGRLVTNELMLVRDAVLRGLGIAMLPALTIQQALEDGRLVPVLPEHVGGQAHIALVFPDRKLLKPAVRAFIEFMAERFDELLDDSARPGT